MRLKRALTFPFCRQKRQVIQSQDQEPEQTPDDTLQGESEGSSDSSGRTSTERSLPEGRQIQDMSGPRIIEASYSGCSQYYPHAAHAAAIVMKLDADRLIC